MHMLELQVSSYISTGGKAKISESLQDLRRLPSSRSSQHNTLARLSPPGTWVLQHLMFRWAQECGWHCQMTVAEKRLSVQLGICSCCRRQRLLSAA